MTPLKVLILNFSVDDLVDAKQVLEKLKAKTIRVDVFRGEQSIAAVDAAYGSAFSAQLIYTMKQVIAGLRKIDTIEKNAEADYLEIYFKRLAEGSGLDFSSAKVRQKLDELAPYFGESGVENVRLLKRLGYYEISELERTGWTTEPSVEEVQTVIDEIKQQRALNRWCDIASNILESMRQVGTSVEEIKAAIQAIQE